jgi:hypothetical protein
MPTWEVLQLHNPANTLLLYAAVSGWRRQIMRVTAFVALVLVLCAVLAHADVPRTVSYQGVLRDNEGNTVPDDSYSIEFNIYDVEVGGTPVWTETQSADVRDGLFNVILGSTTSLDIDFDVRYWLGITIEEESELDPRVELTAAPYALRAAVADSVKPTAVIDDGDWEASGTKVWHEGNVGVGVGSANPSNALEVVGHAYFVNSVDVGSTTNLYGKVYFWDDVVHFNGDMDIYDGDLSIGTGTIHTQSIQPYGNFYISDGVTPFLVISPSEASVGINTWSPGYTLDVNGTVNCIGLRLPTGATNGHVLTSDASGNATWQSAPAPALESGKFNCNADYALLVDCNGVQLLQNGARDMFRIHSNVADGSACYAYYLNGVQVARAVLSGGANYDFTIPTASSPHHAEVILSRPWAGGAVARADIYYQNGRCGGIWSSSH